MHDDPIHPGPRHMDALLSALLDGSLDAAGRAVLTDLVRTDPTARRDYLEYLATHVALQWRYGQTPAFNLPVAVNTEPETRNAEPIASLKPDLSAAKVRVPVVPRWAYALAAALLFAAAALAIYVFVFNLKPETLNPKPPAQPIATVIDAADGSTLVVNDSITHPGSDFATGDISLDRGSAEFRLDSGVEVTLRGDTHLTVHDPMHATLTRGSADFECPHSAKGYTVSMPGGVRVVDLGTRFRVGVDPRRGWTQARVMQGSVRVEYLDGQGGVSHAVKVDAGGLAAMTLDDAGRAVPMVERELLSDPLTGSPQTPLDGTPAVVGNDGATWSAAQWRADGSIGPGDSSNAFVPFTPEAGHVYTLSCIADPTTTTAGSHYDWFALGFSERAATQGAFHEVSRPAAFMILRVMRGDGGIQSHLNNAELADHHAPVGPVRLSIVLDTIAEPWTATWLIDHEPVRGPLALARADAIRYVGFGRSADVQGTIRDFRLTAVKVENGLTPSQGDSR